jgi:RNA polymerase sigma-70 factor (ECF subfamily)
VNRKIDAPTPPSLILRLRDHADAESWTTFVDVYSPLIYEFARLKGLQATDAADVTQEVLLRVAKGIRRFEYDRSKGLFRDWLARIVINEIRRNVSKRRADNLPIDQLEEPSGPTQSVWREQFQQHLFRVALDQCRRQFTEETWLLFEKSWLQKLPIEMVASEANVRVEQVYVARSRVLKRLRYEVALLAEDII